MLLSVRFLLVCYLSVFLCFRIDAQEQRAELQQQVAELIEEGNFTLGLPVMPRNAQFEIASDENTPINTLLRLVRALSVYRLFVACLNV